jgi:hypothetical protein
VVSAGCSASHREIVEGATRCPWREEIFSAVPSRVLPQRDLDVLRASYGVHLLRHYRRRRPVKPARPNRKAEPDGHAMAKLKMPSDAAKALTVPERLLAKTGGAIAAAAASTVAAIILELIRMITSLAINRCRAIAMIFGVKPPWLRTA